MRDVAPGTLLRAFRFACSGFIATAVHAGVALAFLELLAPSPVPANATAWFVATLASYSLNTWWSFSSRPQGRNFRRFYIVSLGGLLLTVTVARLAELAGLPDWQGIVMVLLIVPPLTFAIHSFWTYR